MFKLTIVTVADKIKFYAIIVYERHLTCAVFLGLGYWLILLFHKYRYIPATPKMNK